VRRPGPRPLAGALEAAGRAAAPATVLARVQANWPEVAGPAVAAEATPAAERAGTVTVECRTAAWAHELQLLERDLLERLNAALGDAAAGPVARLRFRAGGPSRNARKPK
jgi:predicted nucleic acid-binding Zn ribbon protein